MMHVTVIGSDNWRGWGWRINARRWIP